MIKLRKNKNNQQRNFCNKKAQITMEFMFCFLVVLIMFWSTIKVLRWTGIDLAERRRLYDVTLTQPTAFAWGNFFPFMGAPFNIDFEDGPVAQLDPYFASPTPLNAWWPY